MGQSTPPELQAQTKAHDLDYSSIKSRRTKLSPYCFHPYVVKTTEASRNLTKSPRVERC